ncbi:hypothetical protein GA0061094_4067 [[Bacillus] enclensis]|uniref:Uncharacterized protein n=1 Tax=[Bacillus] enclensis TaxID=1402860 RepID=A0A1C4DQL3_9BACI|nr:hypothetical protein GA0061094_4067 [[Bacillus] enclensis]
MEFRQAAIGVAACFYIVLIMIVILIQVVRKNERVGANYVENYVGLDNSSI